MERNLNESKILFSTWKKPLKSLVSLSKIPSSMSSTTVSRTETSSQNKCFGWQVLKRNSKKESLLRLLFFIYKVTKKISTQKSKDKLSTDMVSHPKSSKRLPSKNRVDVFL